MKFAPTTYQLPGESVPDWHKRDFASCIEQMERCYLMQRDRVSEGYLGAALHYQHYAARWYERAQAALTRWRTACAMIAAYEILFDPDASPQLKKFASNCLNSQYGKFTNDPGEYPDNVIDFDV